MSVDKVAGPAGGGRLQVKLLLSLFSSCCGMQVSSEIFTLADNRLTAAFHSPPSAPTQQCVYKPTQLSRTAI